MDDQERRRMIDEIEEKMRAHSITICDLKKACKHVITKQYSSAYCEHCNQYFGWWCPDSPNHKCDYNQEDGSYDEDNCRYCGDPEERK